MKVIVHADDLGISPGITDRIIHTHRYGAVRRTSIVANGEAFDRAVEGLRENPQLIWSVHLNLVEGRCLADPRKLSLLVDRRGWFKRDFFGLALLPVLAPWCRSGLRRQIRLELGAQIGRVAQALDPAGIRPAGIRVDSHRYVHLLPLVFSVLMEQAGAWGLREIRVVSEPLFTARRGAAGLIGLVSPNLLKWLVLRTLTRRCRGQLDRRGIGYPRRSLGVLYSGRMTAGIVDRGVQRILRHSPVEDGELEILFHPGPADPQDRSCWQEKPRQSRFYFSSLRAAETEALLSPELRAIVENGPLRKTAARNGETVNWIEYWDSDRIFRSVMRRMTRHFFRTSHRLLGYRESDVVLDFGCGPGFLVEPLQGLVKQVHGVDTSPRMIEECRDKFRNHPDVRFHLLEPDRYTDLTFLGSGFTKTVVLSVIQYFPSVAEVGDLIRSVAAVSAPGASLLIADIPTAGTPLRDTVQLLKSSLREGFLFETLRFLVQTRFSSYSRTRAEQGLLCLPLPALERMIDELDLDAEILTEPLTYNHRRVHLLVHL